MSKILDKALDVLAGVQLTDNTIAEAGEAHLALLKIVYDMDAEYAAELAQLRAENERLQKELATASRALRQTARHMHDAARAKVEDRHNTPDFDTCSNGWCKEAAAALK